MTICKSCGAVIKGNVCEYCGTPAPNIVQRNNQYYIITLPDGSTATCVIKDISAEYEVECVSAIDISGRKILPKGRYLKTITLIEV